MSNNNINNNNYNNINNNYNDDSQGADPFLQTKNEIQKVKEKEIQLNNPTAIPQMTATASNSNGSNTNIQIISDISKLTAQYTDEISKLKEDLSTERHAFDTCQKLLNLIKRENQDFSLALQKAYKKIERGRKDAEAMESSFRKVITALQNEKSELLERIKEFQEKYLALDGDVQKVDWYKTKLSAVESELECVRGKLNESVKELEEKEREYKGHLKKSGNIIKDLRNELRKALFAENSFHSNFSLQQSPTNENNGSENNMQNIRNNSNYNSNYNNYNNNYNNNNNNYNNNNNNSPPSISSPPNTPQDSPSLYAQEIQNDNAHLIRKITDLQQLRSNLELQLEISQKENAKLKGKLEFIEKRTFLDESVLQSLVPKKMSSREIQLLIESNRKMKLIIKELSNKL